MAEPAPAREWVGARLYHGGRLDGLLTGLVRPLIGELTEACLTDGYIFQRARDREGPHLRLRLLPTAGGRPEEIRRLVRERSRRFFAAAPTRGNAPAPAGAAAVKARWPPRLERMTDAALSSRAAGDRLAFVPYRPEHQRYGHGPAPAAVDDHFALCSRTAMRLISAGLPPGRRDVAAFSLILLSWFTAEPDPARLARLPFVRAAGEGGGVGEPLPQPQRQVLRSLAARVRYAADDGGGDALAAWAESLGGLREAVDASRLPEVFNACAHLACNRIGTGPAGERRLRHLAGRAVTEIAEGESAETEGER